MAYSISEECVACGACEPECPVEAITEGAIKYLIDDGDCTDCGSCAQVCPMDAIATADQRINFIKVFETTVKISNANRTICEQDSFIKVRNILSQDFS